MTVQPFTIDVPQVTLDDLQDRLARVRWPDQVEGAGWDYGTNLDYLKELAAYWQTGFDWRAQEAQLNQFAQFRAEIDGVGIHFIHERGKGPNPMPLLLLHGWPDSFYRMYKIIPMLTDPARFGGDPADSFDVVVPSLTGFGFSDRSRQRGMGRDVELLPRLMTEILGYQRFVAHGGDTGSPLAQFIALAQPQAVPGIHLTDVGWNAPLTKETPNLSEAEQAYVAALDQWMANEGAYVMIQGTKPQTLAYGLNDSPVALAGWIVEKFRTWSDCNGEVERRFSKDELLTNIMIYWATETINSSMRWYYEGMHAEWEEAPQGEESSQWAHSDAGDTDSSQWAHSDPSSGVPVGLALFPKDNPPPRETAERTLNVQRWTEMPRGGHFAALEEPELLAEDMRTFFRQFR